MARLGIELPEDLRAKAEVRAAESGHKSVEDYFAALVRADANGAGEDYGAPPGLVFHTQKQLEAMLLEGMAGPASEMTAVDRQELKRRVREGRGE